ACSRGGLVWSPAPGSTRAINGGRKTPPMALVPSASPTAREPRASDAGPAPQHRTLKKKYAATRYPATKMVSTFGSNEKRNSGVDDTNQLIATRLAERPAPSVRAHPYAAAPARSKNGA